jgi:hypothetical protein
MEPLLAKMNFKGEERIAVLNAPESFRPTLEAWREHTAVDIQLKANTHYPFILAFVITQAQLETATAQVGQATGGDAKVWLAYPKGSSKRYKCEFNRDTGWTGLGELGFETVRQVAIDEDWSALRFRRTEYVGDINATKNAP